MFFAEPTSSTLTVVAPLELPKLSTLLDNELTADARALFDGALYKLRGAMLDDTVGAVSLAMLEVELYELT